MKKTKIFFSIFVTLNVFHHNVFSQVWQKTGGLFAKSGRNISSSIA
jgi:hypothetical protein